MPKQTKPPDPGKSAAYNRSQRQAIRRYLAAKIEHASKAELRCKEGAQLDPTGAMAANQRYWRAVKQGLNWARAQIDG